MKEYILTELTLISEENGGRPSPLFSSSYNGQYQQHIVIGDPNQRNAYIIEKNGIENYIDEKYLPTDLWDGPKYDSKVQLPTETPLEITFLLRYSPSEIYNDVNPGATFTFREGKRIIGIGKILKRWSEY